MNSTATSTAIPFAEEKTYTGPLVVLTSLFFIWGLITSLNDILIPHLRAAFELTYVQVMLIQFCFFGAYFVMSLPAGVLVERVGYKAGIVFGLLVASAGCLLFYPAAGTRSYPFFLGALFVLASGITLLQVAANPYVAILGRLETASSRLNLTQAFNSLGTTIGPALGTSLILAAPAVTGDDAVRAAAEASAVQGPYLGLAATLCLIALLVGLVALPRIEAAKPGDSSGMAGHDPGSVWSYRPLVLGAIAIFLYVGAEVSIGSFFVNFVEQPQIAGLPVAVAGAYLSFYWGGAMVGRFVGAFVLRYRKPGSVLAFNALAAVILLAVAMTTAGPTAMWAIIAIGLFNSIMFPTIFTLAIEGLGHRTGEGSGVLCMAIVGGAIVPVAMGWLADHTSLLSSFALPLVCYLYIAYYGHRGHRLVIVHSLILVILFGPGVAGAQTTPWGDPDLQGIWSNQTPVPLERPAALAGKPYFTPAEVAEVEKNALPSVLKNVASEIATSGEFNEVWLESEKGKVNRSRRTSLVADPPDGKIPFTAEGRARWAATPNLATERATGRRMGVDRPEDRALQERCIVSDTIFVPTPFYNNYHQIVQAPGYVVIVSENMHEARVIPLDGRPRLGANIQQWLGDSRGWWEGRTLVVETTNFNDKRRFQGSTKDVRLIERFSRLDGEAINYQLTVTDPGTFSQPWSLENTLWRRDEPVFEYGCHEGNYGLASILSGGRAAEQR